MSGNIITRTIKDKVFLRSAASIAVPVTLQLVLTTVTNMLDTMMIGKLGTATISAVGLANKFFFVFALIIFGVHSGTGLLMAQYFGSGDHHHIRKTFGLGLLINLTVALLFTVFARLFPGTVMKLFTDSTESTQIGMVYLSAVCFCYPLFGCTSLMNSYLKSTKQVRVPLISAAVSIIVNLVLNYCLIFGKFGFPCLGVKGAAIATVIARLSEFLILLYFCFLRASILKGKISEFLGWSKLFLRSFASHALPVICNEMVWGLGTTMYFVAYGHINDNAVAAVTICNTVSDMLLTAGNGLSSATAVLLGNELGAGHMETADDYARKLRTLAILVGAVMGVLLFVLRTPILSLFSVTEEARSASSFCMTVFALLMPLIFNNLIIIVGVLRAGGDTRVCFLLDTAGVWFWAVPLAFLGVMVWHLPVEFIYIFVMSEEFIKFFTSSWRYKQRVWLRNLSHEVQQ